jgi:hypothetical protein
MPWKLKALMHLASVATLELITCKLNKVENSPFKWSKLLSEALNHIRQIITLWKLLLKWPSFPSYRNTHFLIFNILTTTTITLAQDALKDALEVGEYDFIII